MRTIKFRGLRVDGKGWVCGDYITNGGEAEIRAHYSDFFGDFETYEVIPESVGQFTGKLTIDKVEIYEGDLIAPWNGGIPKQVVWDEIFCALYFEIKPFSKLQVLDKIIGNIHEK